MAETNKKKITKKAISNKKSPKKASPSTTKKQTISKKTVKKSTQTKTTKKTIKKKSSIKQTINKTEKNKKTYKIAGIFDRYLAKGLDLIVISFFAFIISHISGILAFILAVAYALFIDAKPEWSLGKGAINLRVLDQETNKPISFKQSALRNSPIAILVALSLIPLFGWILMMIIAIPVLVLEAYLLYNLENHHRLGDIIADTKVVEVESSRKK